MAIKTLQVSAKKLVNQQREFFQSGETQSIDFRLSQLKLLRKAILEHQELIIDATKSDLGRPSFEAYFEIATLSEIKLAIKKLKNWMRPHRVQTPLEQFPSTAWIQPEPLGVVLIIGSWNYPFQLTISPLVGAIAAGNCVILKPSEHAPKTSSAIFQLINSYFSPNYIAAVEGDVNTCKQLLTEKFDHIFFTGSSAVGKTIMKAAANHLTPVTLELGGKSPCIVDTEINLEIAAKRIVWGKFINAGQTCIAPDYLWVNSKVKKVFLKLLKQQIYNFYGDNPYESSDYGRIVNSSHFSRLKNFLENGTIIIGGETSLESLYIAPTILDNVSLNDAVMQEEIFGPILPVLSYENLEETVAYIRSQPKPLAIYVFSNDRIKQNQFLDQTSSGGVCINDTVMQISIPDLPFGGVGNSGMGNYHGKSSFDTFTHKKSVLKKGLWLDLGWRYAPYTVNKLNQIKKIING